MSEPIEDDPKNEIEEVSESAKDVPVAETPPPAIEKSPRPRTPKALFVWIRGSKRRIIISCIAALLIILGLLLIIPLTRYAILSPFIKRDVQVVIIDSQTGKPVSDVTVTAAGISARTGSDGRVTLHKIPAGHQSLTYQKKYYKSLSENVTVPAFSNPPAQSEKLTATGRQVTFTVNDTISHQSLADAKLTVNGSSALTDKSGEATIVVATSPSEQKGTVTKTGYNSADVTISLTDAAKNTFNLTASGSIVFLNNANGTIDVVRSNLDGSGRSVVVAGTGKEDKYSTSLLSSRDWNYSVLKATRTDDKERLYLITTAGGDMSVIDEGNATFSPVGWSGHTFVYIVNRTVPNAWTNGAYSLKGYNADTGKIITYDTTSASGSNYYDGMYQSYGSVYILDNELVFIKYVSLGQNYNWFNDDQGQKSVLHSIDVTSGKDTAVKSFDQLNHNLASSLYEPLGVYIEYDPADTSKAVYYEYEDKAIKVVDAPNGADFYNYPTYLQSPTGSKTFWYELRNGKNTIFIGDKEGKNAKQIATLSEYIPYGWYGSDDQYILFTKNGSELYIAPANEPISVSPLKVTDYYKVQNYRGYGGGYGGQ